MEWCLYQLFRGCAEHIPEKIMVRCVEGAECISQSGLPPFPPPVSDGARSRRNGQDAGLDNGQCFQATTTCIGRVCKLTRGIPCLHPLFLYYYICDGKTGVGGHKKGGGGRGKGSNRIRPSRSLPRCASQSQFVRSYRRWGESPDGIIMLLKGNGLC